MEKTAIELYKTFGIVGAIIVALVIAIIKGYPELLKIIQKKQDIKEKNICKTEKVLTELTTVVTSTVSQELSIVRKETNTQLDKIITKLDENRLQAVKRSIANFAYGLKRNEEPDDDQCRLIQEDCDYYKAQHEKDESINGYVLKKVKRIELYLEKRI